MKWRLLHLSLGIKNWTVPENDLVKFTPRPSEVLPNMTTVKGPTFEVVDRLLLLVAEFENDNSKAKFSLGFVTGKTLCWGSLFVRTKETCIVVLYPRTTSGPLVLLKLFIPSIIAEIRIRQEWNCWWLLKIHNSLIVIFMKVQQIKNSYSIILQNVSVIPSL